MASYSAHLEALSSASNAAALIRLQRGIEKEGLRCDATGAIAQTPHPRGLGSTLTHPSITTDYSESLLEFITPVFGSALEAQAYLEVVHRFTYSQLGSELIWPASMPCILNGEMSVPIADYGTSNIGRLKHVYRHGLWHRYGRIMQCISGIHYNVSLPQELLELLAEQQGKVVDMEFVTDTYLGMIRNFRRYGWLLIYLFGASPAVCKTFLDGRDHALEEFDQHTLYGPYATSLRMSGLGYQSNAQSGLRICHNTLDNYISTLGRALRIPVPEYEAIGVQGEDGEYQQLSTNLLQIENEYYSSIRPKRVGLSGEKPLQSLARAGIEYIEIRSTDVNPFLPVGMDVEQMQFMDLFLLWCALTPSPLIDDDECDQTVRNQSLVVNEGRRPGLMLEGEHGPVAMLDWAYSLIDQMRPLAKLMDREMHTGSTEASLNQQWLKLADSSRTPSAQVLRRMRETGKGFVPLTLDLARQHRKTLSEPLAENVRQHWRDKAETSLAQQKQMEAETSVPFAEYLAAYVSR